jgi:hypothetical protein
MSASTAKATPCLGFLTVVENEELGLLGGYLLLNAAGRPLEFHCTAPVKPNRAQEILYGRTLRPFLYGEQIGQTLLARPKLTPVLVCTDSEPVLAAREVADVPMVLVLDDALSTDAAAPTSPLALGPGQHPFDPSLQPGPFRLGRNRVCTAAAFAGDEALIRQHWPAQADGLDLLEPFARIREALDEAQRSAKAA